MRLLGEIRDAAAADGPLPTILRRCVILGERSAVPELRAWAERELEGYPAGAGLPDYRVLPAQVYGNFAGPYGSGMQDAPVAASSVAERHREALFTSALVQPVAELAALATAGHPLAEHWPADALAIYLRELYPGLNCLAAWRAVTAQALTGALDVLRSRILAIALDLTAAQRDGDAGALAPAIARLLPRLVGDTRDGCVSSHVREDTQPTG